ncbi:MAG: DUF1857 family protein [Limnobacter sp.]|nr:DUF1857 family protein [Limnobacter sp.]
MRFEHLIQINDHSLIEVENLNRAQLWFGLVARAYKPAKFIMGMEGADILDTQLQEGVMLIKRRLDFGSFKIFDEVELHEEQRTVNRIYPSEFSGASSMVIQIEEPQPEELWLRFTYHIEDLDGANPEQGLNSQQMNEARRQAYKAADIDTVTMIRELARSLPI